MVTLIKRPLHITPDPLTGNRQLVTTENINSVHTQYGHEVMIEEDFVVHTSNFNNYYF